MNITNAPSELQARLNTGLQNHPKQSKPGRNQGSRLSPGKLSAEAAASRDQMIAAKKTGSEPPAHDHIGYIREHGMQAYVMDVQRQKLGQMQAEVLVRKGVFEVGISEMSGDQRNKIEQMISDKIQKRMEANSLMNDDTANQNGSYLKTMMMANGSHSFFEGPSVSGISSLKEHLEHTVKNDPAYTFFRSNAAEK